MDHAQVKMHESEDKKPERKRRAGILPTVAALTGIGIAALTGCSPDAGATPEPTSTSAEASPSATPEPTETSGPREYTDQELIDMENEPLPESLEKYESMSVEDFKVLPIEERLSYCSYLNRDQDYLEGAWYDSYGGDPKYLLPDDLGKESTGQEIITQDAYNISNAFTTHFGGIIEDIDTRVKQISCATYNANSLSRGADLEAQLREAGDFIVPPGIWAEQDAFKIKDFVSEEAPSTVTTDSGKEYFSRKVTSVDGLGRTFPDTYILVDYTNYKGEAKQTYVYYQ